MRLRHVYFLVFGWMLFTLCPTVPPTVHAKTLANSPGQSPGETPCFTEMEIPSLPVYLPEGDAGGDEMTKGQPLLVVVRWRTVSGGSSETKHITVDISPSSFVGQCLNSGKAIFQDFTIEEQDNPDWDLNGVDLIYSGNQTLSATTKFELADGEDAEILIRAYDWRGEVLIDAEAPSCTPIGMQAPQDSDGDKLPDAFEMGSFYYTAGRVKTEFNFGLPKSGGLQAASDDLDDSDLDNRATPKHQKFGDGLTAREEYEAVKVSGEVKRTRDLDNNGPGGGKGGTHLKDIFVFDERKAQAQKFFNADNAFLEDYKLIWHLIDEGDMKRSDAKLAGVIDFTGPDANSSQFAVWLHLAEKPLTFTGGRLLADAQDRTINAGKPILLDLDHINKVADTFGIPQNRLMNWAVAHELGHKFSLEHVRRFRERVAAEPAPPDFDNFWVTAGGRQTNMFVPLVIGGGKPNELERFLTYDPKPAFEVKAVMPVAPAPGGAEANLHGEKHRVGSVRVITAPDVLPAGITKLIVEAHLKTLMDFSPHPADLEAIQMDPLLNKATDDGLNPAQEEVIEVGRDPRAK